MRIPLVALGCCAVLAVLAGATAASPGEAAPEAPAPATTPLPVNLNAAPAEAIAGIAGLAEGEARSLVEARSRLGWFRSWREVAESAPDLSDEAWAALRARGRLGPPPAAVLEARLDQWRRRR
ncbi:helix-hairpin-helix domain-containing protein [Myxococcota bacterium]|nr:helix-hairpin-helix domain-containing protein [Myxococcota bacterium]